MSPLDLIRGDDGKMVLTKLAAATYHFVITVAVVAVTSVRLYRYVKSGEPPTGNELLFDTAMWTLYATSSVGHAVADKAGAQVLAFKNRQLETEAGPVADTVTTEMKVTEKKTV